MERESHIGDEEERWRRMTIDEAIKHSEEVAEEHTKYNRYGGFESCDECAKEHRQLAGWLKELKQLREQTR